MKSSAMLLHLSLHSMTSFVSSAAIFRAKAIGLSVKCFKKGVNTTIWPLKWAKHALSNFLLPVISSFKNDSAINNQASIKTNKLPDIIAVGSDEKLDDLKKELGPSLSICSLLQYLTHFNS
jgi:hypothetical protein